jgi:hypothetical protein
MVGRHLVHHFALELRAADKKPLVHLRHAPEAHVTKCSSEESAERAAALAWP